MLCRENLVDQFYIHYPKQWQVWSTATFGRYSIVARHIENIAENCLKEYIEFLVESMYEKDI